MKYKDATAFRVGLTARLRNENPDEDLGRLLKRAAMERFLARTAEALPDKILLKGGYALELRLDRARATQDLDLSVCSLPAEEVLEAIRDAAEVDMGDYLSYRVEETSREMPQGAPYGGERLTVVPLLGGKRFQPFPLDVGLGDAMSSEPEVLGGGIDLSFAGLPPLEVPAVPVEVHLAEKLHALSLPRPEGRQNSRVKDLVDVMLLQKHGLPPITQVRQAVADTFERRKTHELPDKFELRIDAWEREYGRFALELELHPFAPNIHVAEQRLQKLLLELTSYE